jgi:nucleoside-triphosphatase
MPQNFFITGHPKVGKTTLLRDIISELKNKGLRVGGFISPEEQHHGTRTAFYVKDIESGKIETLASVDGDGPKISKYHVNVKSFESIAIQAMERADTYDVFVIDEIGRMEMESEKFVQLLDGILESEVPLIATVHQEYVETYCSSGEIFELDESNRGVIRFDILRRAEETFNKKKQNAKYTKKKVIEPEMEQKKSDEQTVKKSGKEKIQGKSKTVEKKREVKRTEQKKPEEESEEEPEEKRGKQKKKPASSKKNLVEHLKELFRG